MNMGRYFSCPIAGSDCQGFISRKNDLRYPAIKHFGKKVTMLLKM